MPSPTHARVVVVGAGQAGLATAFHLDRRDVPFVALADDERIGDTWRDRWDSLELFTPAFYDGLPGLLFPADPEYLPHKSEMADYLETYARHFEFPVRLSTQVTRLERSDGLFYLETTRGPYTADAVVVATGAHSTPSIPPFADDLPAAVDALHSSEYHNPDQLGTGEVLVVGAGNSGTQIAAELGERGDRRVWLAGPDTGTLPRRLLGRDVYRFLAPTVLRISRSSFIGRRLHARMADSGDPVFADQARRLERTDVERLGRVVGVEDDRLVTVDGERVSPETVVWATGFRPDYPWIGLDVFGPDGAPEHDRGEVPNAPGLYFVGLRWQTRASSSLIGGVGRDAAHVADRIAR